MGEHSASVDLAVPADALWRVGLPARRGQLRAPPVAADDRPGGPRRGDASTSSSRAGRPGAAGCCSAAYCRSTTTISASSRSIRRGISCERSRMLTWTPGSTSARSARSAPTRRGSLIGSGSSCDLRLPPCPAPSGCARRDRRRPLPASPPAACEAVRRPEPHEERKHERNPREPRRADPRPRPLRLRDPGGRGLARGRVVRGRRRRRARLLDGFGRRRRRQADGGDRRPHRRDRPLRQPHRQRRVPLVRPDRRLGSAEPGRPAGDRPRPRR